MKWLYKYKQRQATNGSNHNLCLILIFLYPVFSRGTRAQHLTLCVWCPCGVPWMDAMLQSVREERQLYSHNQCVQYRCTHSRGHNIDMNRAGILA